MPSKIVTRTGCSMKTLPKRLVAKPKQSSNDRIIAKLEAELALWKPGSIFAIAAAEKLEKAKQKKAVI